MTHRIEDGPKMIEAVKRYNRVLQVGSQGRSSSLQKKAREIVASGQLGKVSKIIASYNRNSSNGAWNYPVPPDLKEGVNFNWRSGWVMRPSALMTRSACSAIASTGIIPAAFPPTCLFT